MWDADSGQVVGLVVRAWLSRNARLAFAVSGETVFDAWPDLRESFLRACPFRSLRPFQAGDSDLFFGRDEFAADAAGTISRSDYTVVSGPSGAGKTSLMNAAVIPELGRQGHAVITVRPLDRDSLWEAMAAAVAGKDFPAGMDMRRPGASFDQRRSEAQLKEDFAGETVQSRVRRLCGCLGADRVVVVVDQSEEVLRAGGPRARAFGWDLGQIPSVRHPEGRPFARVVMVVREDDEAQLRSLLPFDGDAVSVVHVGALSAAQLRAAVEEPVRRSGFARYEEKLPDRIIDEVRVQPYSLPALQVILTELWERQGPDGLLRHGVYQELNRGAGPLATHLERLWHQLTPADRDAAARLFLHLVMPVGEDGFARRAASQAEVNPGDWPVAGTLATQRLVVLRGSPSGGALAELAHDSLIEQWPTLAGHLSAYREFLQWRDDLRRRISAWRQSGKQPSQLLTGAALKRALAQQDTQPQQLSQQEREFLQLSRTRVRKLRRRAFLSITTVLILIAGLLAFAVIQNRSAQQNKAVALSRQLAATSAQLLNTNPQLAALLSVAAYKISHTSEAQASLAKQFQNLEYIYKYLNPGSGLISGTAFSPDGRILATREPSRVSLWNISSGALIDTIPAGAGSQVSFSPDGRTLAIPEQNAILLLEVATHRLAFLRHASGPVYFGSQGRTLVSFSTDESKLIVWDRVHSRGSVIWCQAAAGSGGSQGFPASAG